MKELHPVYFQGDNNRPIFVERTIKDQCQCIVFNESTEQTERFMYPSLSLVSVFDSKHEVRLEYLDLWFKVKSTDKTMAVIGDSPGLIGVTNSVLQLHAMSTEVAIDVIAYKLRSGGKSFWFHPGDIGYLPMLKDGTRKIDCFTKGCKTIALFDNPCHGLIKGEIYSVQEVIADTDSLFNGTIYGVNIKTGERITTYPKNLKLII
jgi:hypothetical protein